MDWKRCQIPETITAIGFNEDELKHVYVHLIIRILCDCSYFEEPLFMAVVALAALATIAGCGLSAVFIDHDIFSELWPLLFAIIE